MISVSMYSSTVKDTMVIDVSFPGSYKADLTTRYPVLYLTDGYWRRGQHGPIHSMAKTENVREMIVVGIGYPSSYDPNSIRVRDLIRNPDRFLDFILHELIPYVDKEFRTTNERTLWGSSYGGFFAMFTLFRYAEKTKGAFQNYVVVSPAALETAYYDGSETNLFDFERMLSAKTTDLNLGLYVSCVVLYRCRNGQLFREGEAFHLEDSTVEEGSHEVNSPLRRFSPKWEYSTITQATPRATPNPLANH